MNTFHRLHFTSFYFVSLHFTSQHFTTLHPPFFTTLHFWTFRHHTSKTLHFSLIINFITEFLKICDLQGESHQRFCRQLVPQFDCPVYNGVFTDICSLLPGPNFTIVIIPAQVAWSL